LHSCCCIYFLLCSGFILFCVGLKDFIWNSLLNKQIKKEEEAYLFTCCGGLEATDRPVRPSQSAQFATACSFAPDRPSDTARAAQVGPVPQQPFPSPL
jgi:hypothetical protein